MLTLYILYVHSEGKYVCSVSVCMYVCTLYCFFLDVAGGDRSSEVCV